MKTYLLRLSADHAKAVVHALEFYCRVRMGQLREISDELSDIDFGQRDAADDVCDQLTRILFPELIPGSYHSYASERTGNTAHLCYEVEKSLRHRVSWTERPLKKGDMPICSHDAPILFPSGVSPRPECAAEDGRQPELEYNGLRVSDALADLVGTRDAVESLRVIRRWKAAAASVGMV